MVKRTPIHPDANRLSVLDRHLDDCLEVLVAMLAPHIPRVNSIFRKKRCGFRMCGEELMPVVVKITHNGSGESVICKALDDLGDRCGRRIIVDGDTHQLASGAREMCDLRSSAGGIRSVRVGH